MFPVKSQVSATKKLAGHDLSQIQSEDIACTNPLMYSRPIAPYATPCHIIVIVMVDCSNTLTRHPWYLMLTNHARLAQTVVYFAIPSSALKQSVNCLLCLFEAWSVSIFWLVVPWKVWKQVLHLMVWAAAF
jgi:hypothetical protein